MKQKESSVYNYLTNYSLNIQAEFIFILYDTHESKNKKQVFLSSLFSLFYSMKGTGGFSPPVLFLYAHLSEADPFQMGFDGMKGFRADHMLDAARIGRGRLRADAKLDE